MAFAAMGCNPQQKGQSRDDIGGAALGTLAFSPDGGLYVAIQADGAIGVGEICQIEGDWQIDELANADTSYALCIPQVALADNDYGWGLVFGNGTALAGENIASGAKLYGGTADGEVVDTEGTNIKIAGINATASASDGAQVPVAVMWPSVDVIA